MKARIRAGICRVGATERRESLKLRQRADQPPGLQMRLGDKEQCLCNTETHDIFARLMKA